MDDFLVAGPADNPEDALTLMRATAIASFGEAVREIARQNFQYCAVHRRAVPRLDASAEGGDPAVTLPGPAACVCPADPAPNAPDLGAGPSAPQPLG